MGKKINHVSKGKKAADKELQPASRQCTLNLHRRTHKVQFKKKAPIAIKEIKQYAMKTMFTKDVRIDPELNKQVWRNGIRNIDRRVEVVLERKKNEDEEAKEQMFTIVKLAK